MLGKGKQVTTASQTRVATVIGPETTIEGNLKASDATRVEGVVRGEITSEGSIIIGTSGRVFGNILAGTVLVAGTVEGDIEATVKIEAASTGKIIGDITTKSLIIDENAVFQGSCHMQGGSRELPKIAHLDMEDSGKSGEEEDSKKTAGKSDGAGLTAEDATV